MNERDRVLGWWRSLSAARQKTLAGYADTTVENISFLDVCHLYDHYGGEDWQPWYCRKIFYLKLALALVAATYLYCVLS